MDPSASCGTFVVHGDVTGCAKCATGAMYVSYVFSSVEVTHLPSVPHFGANVPKVARVLVRQNRHTQHPCLIWHICAQMWHITGNQYFRIILARDFELKYYIVVQIYTEVSM